MDAKDVIEGLEPILGCARQEKWGAWIESLEKAIVLLKEQEAVVRCKDCKYWEDAENCSVYDLERPEDWFCADGKRK